MKAAEKTPLFCFALLCFAVEEEWLKG